MDSFILYNVETNPYNTSKSLSAQPKEIKKGSFTYTGALVFNGNGTATLTLNGTVYTINLTTGFRAKV